MKIISKEKFHSNIDYILKKDLLIPCFVYKIPIETSRNKILNFIEESILKLIHVDDSLKNDIDRLSEMLGFCKKNKKKECIEDKSDRRKIVKLILLKLKELSIDTIEEESSTEVTIYQFYQEAYSKELLPLITKEINEFSYVEKDWFKDENYREVLFKEEIHSKYPIKAILANGYRKDNFSKPNKSDIIKTIYTHR